MYILYNKSILKNMAIRLDKFLATKYNQYSRNKINDFIKKGFVTVNNKTVDKPSLLVDDNDKVELNVSKDDIYVSRAAVKLLKAIETYNIDLNNKVCLDIGCSTGGFTQVMLKHNAQFVYAVDVGTDQFDKSILCDKVKLMEQTNFVSVPSNLFDKKIDFIACDVSFISATKIIKHVCDIFRYPFKFVCLIKPQFELTKQILDKCEGTIPSQYHKQAISSVCSCAKALGLSVSEVVESPILGAKGNNTEFLVLLERK